MLIFSLSVAVAEAVAAAQVLVVQVATSKRRTTPSHPDPHTQLSLVQAAPVQPLQPKIVALLEVLLASL